MAPITVMIPVSALPSHPDTVILDETLVSIRERLPDSLIILMFDGVRPDIADLESRYKKFINTMLWRGEHEIGNVLPIVFEEHHHQSLMMYEALQKVDTSLILWSEQDTPLCNEIPFDQIGEVVDSGYANVVRFSHESLILPDHQHLMLDTEPHEILGVPLVRTIQWSGRPHLASTKFYREQAESWNRADFIEHLMYGKVVEGSFDDYRVHLYAPGAPYPEGTILRSLHTDGRRFGAGYYDPRVS